MSTLTSLMSIIIKVSDSEFSGISKAHYLRAKLKNLLFFYLVF